jgi:hypothetical protein
MCTIQWCVESTVSEIYHPNNDNRHSNCPPHKLITSNSQLVKEEVFEGSKTREGELANDIKTTTMLNSIEVNTQTVCKYSFQLMLQVKSVLGITVSGPEHTENGVHRA